MALTDNLVAYWRLEEASGIRVDSVGSNNLADNNTVTQAVGRIGNAARFINANTEYLSIADNVDLSAGNVDFAFVAWVYLDNKTTSQGIVAKWPSAGAEREYVLQYNQPADRFRLVVSDNGTDAQVATANNFGSPSTATLYFIVCWHDATANTINIQVNNGTADSTAHAAGIHDGTGDFLIGGLDPVNELLDGRVDAVGFWRKVLPASEKTQLYNNGSGLEYPFTAPAPFTVLKPTLEHVAAISNNHFQHSRYQGILGHWLLGEGGGLNAYDISGGSHLGAWVGVGDHHAQGQFGVAGQFNGNDDNILLATIGPKINVSAGTIIIWFNSTVWTAVTGEANVLISLRVDANNNIEIFHLESDGLFHVKYKAGGTAKEVTMSSAGISNGILHCVVLTWDVTADEVKAFLDAAQIGSTLTGLGVWAGTIDAFARIGTQGISSPADIFGYEGLIESLPILNRAITLKEVISHFDDPFLEFETEDTSEWLLPMVGPPPPIQSRISVAQP